MSDASGGGPRPSVLVLAKEFPNAAKPRSGLWVASLVQALAGHADLRVVAPLPRLPPLVPSGLWAALRALPREERLAEVRVVHPRQTIGIGQSLHSLEGDLYLRAVRPVVRRLHAERPIELIHAHFVYPDGFAAGRLAEELGVPFIVTEHAFWKPWLDRWPWVRVRAVRTAERAACVVAVSEALRDSITAVVGDRARTEVIPNGVDVETFAPREGRVPERASLLYVGWPTRTKGLDVLVRALRAVRAALPEARLAVVGESLWRTQRREEREIRALAAELGVREAIDFVGPAAPAEVAERMRRAALVVVPSRRESFGSVIVEAMACGRPVVATRSGGPSEIVTPECGLLVPPDDPEALAQAVVDVLADSARFEPRAIRERACRLYAWPVVARRVSALYREILQAAR